MEKLNKAFVEALKILKPKIEEYEKQKDLLSSYPGKIADETEELKSLIKKVKTFEESMIYDSTSKPILDRREDKKEYLGLTTEAEYTRLLIDKIKNTELMARRELKLIKTALIDDFLVLVRPEFLEYQSKVQRDIENTFVGVYKGLKDLTCKHFSEIDLQVSVLQKEPILSPWSFKTSQILANMLNIRGTVHVLAGSEADFLYRQKSVLTGAKRSKDLYLNPPNQKVLKVLTPAEKHKIREQEKLARIKTRKRANNEGE